MTRLAALLPAFLLAGCFGNDERPAASFPVLPDLPAEAAVPCPPADLLTGTLADLVTKDAALALEYAKCRARAATAVGAYQDAQRRLREAAAADAARDATEPR